MKKLLKQKLGLKPTKIKTPQRSGGQNHAYLCFRTDEEKEEALRKLDGYKWKGNVLKAKVYLLFALSFRFEIDVKLNLYAF